MAILFKNTQIVYKTSKNRQNIPVLAAPTNCSLPRVRHHPYEAQLDALETVLCTDTITQALGLAPLQSIADLEIMLERYRTTLLEPIELPAITHSSRLSARGHADELIALDQDFAGMHPEWLLLMPASTRMGSDYLNRLRPLQDERVVQKFIESVKYNRSPGHHLMVFGLTMAVFSIARRQGLAEYAQFALEAVVSTAAGKLKITQEERATILARAQTHLPQALNRMVA